ncbi:hypothetical protein GGTG_05465 [Gaeumannomyces tritici R3-111a-1]|uniref:Transcription factor Rba50 n=1 Tax=Gaeumannomyces tritici (strain R3-111a-1) TaxID=644352 RepID=J3NW02_GAET3|nr:hypothetical protein GGTG_05465 [Gaeumannomyces tritici R3-111a-1]EJT75532.1 hypothetical protein GGTG_05465 [Gaeumannomyces tritici R3-111a-1]
MESTLRVFDIQEKQTGEAKAPSFPQIKSTASGFPEHKKRSRVSTFKKQRREAGAGGGDNKGEVRRDVPASIAPEPRSGPGGAGGGPANGLVPPGPERRTIDRENRQRLAAMSSAEIADAQAELLSSLDPNVLQMLLRRANLDEKPPGPDPFAMDSVSSAPLPASTKTEGAEGAEENTMKELRAPKKTVSFAATVEDEVPEPPSRQQQPDQAPPEQPSPAPQQQQEPPKASTNTTHFPHATGPPELDPSDPNFLEALHQKYFPNLAADPAKLAWMAPLPTEGSPADRDSPYYPGQTSLAVSQLRFDFAGRLLPPRLSRQIPTTKGLHHHGEAPEAAGYTVAELARLARSAVPAQRCIAFRTLGRILFRLGKGEWGPGDEGSMAMGVFRQVSEGRVLDSLNEAASVEEGTGHRAARAYAIEALWLYEKGGWRASFSGR